MNLATPGACLIVLLICLGSPFVFSQEVPKEETKPDAETVSKAVYLDEIYERVELEPFFSDDHGKLDPWIQEKIRLVRKINPKLPHQTVKARLVVEKDGTLTNLTYLDKCSGKLKRETQKIIAIMPKWRPAYQNGRAVRAYTTLTFDW